MDMKKIPYGISDYQRIAKKNYLYVDKTRYIEVLENTGEPYIYLFRPRRFGKSLFVSILDFYYDINSKDHFIELFGNTYIGKNPTEERNSYYILRFDFSGINTSTEDQLIRGFTKELQRAFLEFVKRYDLKLQYQKDDLPSDYFKEFLANLTGELAAPIYVLIDEYEHFANEILSFNLTLFENAINKNGFVRKWYEVLKSATSRGTVGRIFITGVSPVTLDSLTSGFNIGKNKSTEPRFNECLGFTEDEVKWVLRNTLGDSINVEKEMPVLKGYYNGYLFNKQAENRIYNSDMILYYISEYQTTGMPPEQLIDTNISSDYHKIASIFAVKNEEQNMEVLEEIIAGKSQSTLLTREFSLAKRFGRDDFNSLLFYLGFLTIDKPRLTSVELVVPNYVIKELYFDYFREIIRKNAQYNLDLTFIRNSIENIAVNGDTTDFIQLVCNTLKRLSNRDFQRFDEKYIKVIMLTYLISSRVYYVKSEDERNRGYTDIVLLPRPGINVPYTAVFEIKYIRKEEYCEQLLSKKISEAEIQIARYKEDPELRDIKNLLKIILVFCNDQVVYENTAK